jgi:hypothetical protein
LNWQAARIAPKNLRFPGINSGEGFQTGFARFESCPSLKIKGGRIWLLRYNTAGPKNE